MFCPIYLRYDLILQAQRLKSIHCLGVHAKMKLIWAHNRSGAGMKTITESLVKYSFFFFFFCIVSFHYEKEKIN